MYFDWKREKIITSKTAKIIKKLDKLEAEFIKLDEKSEELEFIAGEQGEEEEKQRINEEIEQIAKKMAGISEKISDLEFDLEYEEILNDGMQQEWLQRYQIKDLKIIGGPLETKIINIKSKEAYDIYIGRWNQLYGLQKSIWANPFKLGKDGTGEEVLKKYREHVLSKPELLKKIPELRGKTLACWCKPGPCHGDVLIELLEETNAHDN